KRHQSSSPMRSRPSTPSQRIRSSWTFIAPTRRNWPRCSPSRPARRNGRGSWNARCLLPTCPPRFPVELRDFLLLERTGTRTTDLGAWIYDIDVLTTSGREQDLAAAKADALGRWRERRSLPWLVAALMHLPPGDDDVAAASAASLPLEAGSPAYYTLGWHRLRLLLA